MANKAQNNPAEPISNEEVLALQASQGDLIAEQAEQIESLKNLIREMQSGEEQKSSKATGGVICKVGKAEYRVTHGLLLKGKKLSPAEIAQDAELCKQLVADKSTALEQL